MGSKWLDVASSSEASREECASANSQPSTSGRHSASGRQHGARWFSVMQGIRRSLDIHFKSYYKIDSVYASIQRLSAPSDKLKALTRAVTETGLVDFCCIYLVHPARGTFGVMALNGVGSELYPPRLADEEGQRAARMWDSASASSLNVFTRCVFQVKDSNWCVEDVVASRAPWYYDCASAANGFGLPQDGSWLRRAGMRSLLALPCLQGNDVTGVLSVASKQKSLDHLLLHKLEELCYKITPTVTDAVMEFSTLLCNRRIAAPYESITDFAHEVLGELMNLDRAVVASVGSTQQCEGDVQTPHAAAVTGPRDRRQPAASAAESRARQAAAAEPPAFNAISATAAAAAAGFSWIAPTVAEVAATVLPTRLQVHRHEEPSPSTDTHCAAITDAAPYSVVLTSDLPSLPLQYTEVPPTCSSSPASDRLTLTLAEMADKARTKPALESAGGDAALTPAALEWCRAPFVATSRSLPDRNTPSAAAAGAAAMDYLRGSETAPCCLPECQTHPQLQQQPWQQQQQQKPGGNGATSVVASSTDHNASRSTRSLSCVEFSGGLADAREELLSSQKAVAIADGAIGAAPAVAPGCGGQTAAASIGNTPRRLRAPRNCNGTASGDAGPGQEVAGMPNRTSESGDGFMIESQSTEELAAVLRHGNGNGGGSLTTSPSVWSSKNTESRIMQRGMPLESSSGGGAAAGCRIASALAATANTQLAPPVVPRTTMGMCNSCTTDYSMAAVDTVTSYGYTNSSYNTIPAMYGSNLPRLSGVWDSQCGGSGVSEVGDVRRSLHVATRGRWSRDSAAAAAAVWSNEAAEAVAAAMHFTATQAADEKGPVKPPLCGNDEPTSVWTACAHRSAALASASAAPQTRWSGCAAGKSAALGGLYDIRESGPVPSLQLSLDFSDSDDGGVVVVDLPSSDSSGCAFVLNSGLGVEAMQWQQGTTNVADLSTVLLPACETTDLLAAVEERLVVRA
ncbi:hypothetical protein Vretimale_10413 [Volvox reticuliferus]|uniref:GAF domain-containing protein n=1 Tax=Volvox reticuliferus TaxID=1737510 RepID=A0A8J4CJD0_9CHLO|nr:hypothetical protein Vretifemale_12277 [Volvox reticuliferus]GIM06004.1 hypothetical protein Vretimale_10413 [Volvox reticuliferus]